MDNKFFAYLAGYIDGDGHFRFRNYIKDGYSCFHCKLMITSTNKEPLEYFMKNIGGTFYAKKKSNEKWKQEYIYTLHIGKETFYKIKPLGRFLIEKLSQFQMIESFFKGDKLQKKEICSLAKTERDSFKVTPTLFNSIKEKFNTIKPKPIDYHYLAGFLDAEGALTVTRKVLKKTGSLSFSCHLRVTNTKFPCIEFIVTRFGGCLHFRKSIKKNSSDCVQWELTDKSAEPILKKLNKILIVKKRQCQELLNLRHTYVNRLHPRDKNFASYYTQVTPTRECVFLTVKDLNKRGL